MVYAAYDPELDRKVAVKLLQTEVGGSSRGTRGGTRLVREAQAMAARFDEARVELERALALREAELGGAHVEVAKLGDWQAALAESEQGLAILRAGLGDAHPLVGVALHSVGAALFQLGEPEPQAD